MNEREPRAGVYAALGRARAVHVPGPSRVGRAWDAAAADVVLEEQAHRLLHRGGGVAGGPIVALQRTLQQPPGSKLQIFGLNRNNPMTPDGV